MSKKILKLMSIAVCAIGIFFGMGTLAKADVKQGSIELSKESIKLKTGSKIIIGADDTADIKVKVSKEIEDEDFAISADSSKLVKIKVVDEGFEVTALKKGKVKLKIALADNENVSKILKLSISGKKKAAYKGVREVTAKNFEKEVLKAKGKVLVDFSAKWCGYCQLLEPIYKEASKMKPQYKFMKMDADKEVDFIANYEGVEGYPTIHLYENGKLVDIGGYSPNMDVWTLLDWIEKKR